MLVLLVVDHYQLYDAEPAENKGFFFKSSALLKCYSTERKSLKILIKNSGLMNSQLYRYRVIFFKNFHSILIASNLKSSSQALACLTRDFLCLAIKMLLASFVFRPATHLTAALDTFTESEKNKSEAFSEQTNIQIFIILVRNLQRHEKAFRDNLQNPYKWLYLFSK